MNQLFTENDNIKQNLSHFDTNHNKTFIIRKTSKFNPHKNQNSNSNQSINNLNQLNKKQLRVSTKPIILKKTIDKSISKNSPLKRDSILEKSIPSSVRKRNKNKKYCFKNVVKELLITGQFRDGMLEKQENYENFTYYSETYFQRYNLINDYNRESINLNEVEVLRILEESDSNIRSYLVKSDQTGKNYIIKLYKVNEENEEKIQKYMTILHILSEESINSNFAQLKHSVVFNQQIQSFFSVLNGGTHTLEDARKGRKIIWKKWTQGEILYILNCILNGLLIAYCKNIVIQELHEYQIIITNTYQLLLMPYADITEKISTNLKKSYKRSTSLPRRQSILTTCAQTHPKNSPKKEISTIEIIGLTLRLCLLDEKPIKDPVRNLFLIERDYPEVYNLFKGIVEEDGFENPGAETLSEKVSEYEALFSVPEDLKLFEENYYKLHENTQKDDQNMLGMCYLYENIGCFEKSINIYSSLYERILENNNKQNQKRTGQIIGQLALNYGLTRNYQKCEYFMRLFTVFLEQKYTSENELEKWQLKAQLSDVYMLLNQQDKAIENLQKCKEQIEKCQRAEDYQQIHYIMCLSELYFRQGDYSNAIEEIEYAQNILKKGLGNEHPLIVKLQIKKAEILMKLENKDIVNQTLEKALDMVSRFYGKVSLNVIRYYDRVIRLLLRNNEFKTALGVARDVLSKIKNQVYSQEKLQQSSLAQFHELYGDLVMQLDDTTLALYEYQQSCRIYEENMCKGHPYLLKILNIVADLYRKFDQERSLQVYDKLIGNFKNIPQRQKIPLKNEILQNLGDYHFKKKSFAKAFEYFKLYSNLQNDFVFCSFRKNSEKVFSSLTRTLQNMHLICSLPQQNQTENNQLLGGSLLKIETVPTISNSIQKSIRNSIFKLRVSSPRTQNQQLTAASILQNLRLLIFKNNEMGDFDKCCEFFKRAKNYCRDIYGTTSIEQAELSEDMAQIYYTRDSIKQGLMLDIESLTIKLKILPCYNNEQIGNQLKRVIQQEIYFGYISDALEHVYKLLQVYSDESENIEYIEILCKQAELYCLAYNYDKSSEILSSAQSIINQENCNIFYYQYLVSLNWCRLYIKFGLSKQALFKFNELYQQYIIYQKNQSQDYQGIFEKEKTKVQEDEISNSINVLSVRVYVNSMKFYEANTKFHELITKQWKVTQKSKYTLDEIFMCIEMSYILTQYGRCNEAVEIMQRIKQYIGSKYQNHNIFSGKYNCIMAQIYLNQINFERAVIYAKEALSIVSSLSGSNSLETSLIADICSRVTLVGGVNDNLYKFITKYHSNKEKALQCSEATKCHYWLGDSLENLAIYYIQIYNFHHAQDILEKVRCIRNESLGDFDYKLCQTVKTLYTQGQLEICVGDLEKAKRTIEKYVSRVKDIFGEENEEYSKALTLQCHLHLAYMKYNKVKSTLEKATELLKGQTRHILFYEQMRIRFQVKLNQGEIKECMYIYVQLKLHTKSVYTKESLQYCQLRELRADYYSVIGLVNKALNKYNLVESTWKSLLSKHMDLFIMRINIKKSEILLSMMEIKQCSVILKEVEGYLLTEYPGSKYFGKVYYIQSKIQWILQETVQAEILGKQALENQKYLGDKHYIYQQILSLIQRIKNEDQFLVKVKDYLVLVVNQCKIENGIKNINYIEISLELAEIYEKRGYIEDAMQLIGDLKSKIYQNYNKEHIFLLRIYILECYIQYICQNYLKSYEALKQAEELESSLNKNGLTEQYYKGIIYYYKTLHEIKKKHVNYTKAKIYIEKGIQVISQYIGQNHIYMLPLLCFQGKILIDMDKVEEAFKFASQLNTKFADIIDAQKEFYWNYLQELFGFYYYKIRKFEQANEFFEMSLNKKQKVMSSLHPCVIENKNIINQIKQMLSLNYNNTQNNNNNNNNKFLVKIQSDSCIPYNNNNNNNISKVQIPHKMTSQQNISSKFPNLNCVNNNNKITQNVQQFQIFRQNTHKQTNNNKFRVQCTNQEYFNRPSSIQHSKQFQSPQINLQNKSKEQFLQSEQSNSRFTKNQQDQIGLLQNYPFINSQTQLPWNQSTED